MHILHPITKTEERPARGRTALDIKPRQKHFNFSRYGSSEAALAAAIQYRDTQFTAALKNQGFIN
jgi:hypothetical protein